MQEEQEEPKAAEVPQVPALPADTRSISLVSTAVGRPLVPTTFEGCWRLAKIMVMGRMVPEGFLKKTDEENIAAVFGAIQYGLTLGLEPSTSVQVVANINGRVGLHSMGPMGVVLRSGKMEYHREWVEGHGKDMVAICVVKRVGAKEEREYRFSWSQAENARLTAKDVWKAYPEDMLISKAVNRALRREFPDVLMGGGMIEEEADFIPVDAEVRSVPEPGTVESTKVRAPRKARAEMPEPTTEPKPEPASAPKPEPVPTPEPKSEPAPKPKAEPKAKVQTDPGTLPWN